MTTIRQLVPMAGERYIRNAGDVYETDAAEAERLAAAGIAEVVSSEAKASPGRGKARGNAKTAARGGETNAGETSGGDSDQPAT